jgi:hypothetical protein
MALVIQTADQTAFGDDSSRRRSTFYVPLSTEDLTSRDEEHVDAPNGIDRAVFNPSLSGYSCDWSLNDSIDGSTSEMLISREKSQLSSDDSNRLKRYGIVLNGSVDIDDSNLEVHANYKRKNSKNLTSSTPIKDIVTKNKHPDVEVNESVTVSKATLASATTATKPKTVITLSTPLVEKSKTLPVKDTQQSTFPPKNSYILKSTPKISSSINNSSLSDSSPLKPHQQITATPKKSMSFIRRAHSTKLSRNNSLLKSLATKCVEHSNDSLNSTVYDLSTERLALYMRSENCDDLVKDLFFRGSLDTSHSDNCEKNKENGNDDDDGMSGKRKN